MNNNIFLRTYPAVTLFFLRTYPVVPFPRFSITTLLSPYFSSHLPCCALILFSFTRPHRRDDGQQLFKLEYCWDDRFTPSRGVTGVSTALTRSVASNA